MWIDKNCITERKRAGVLSGDDDDDEGDGEADGLHDAVTKRLKREELEDAGKLKLSVADNFSKEAAPDLVQTRWVFCQDLVKNCDNIGFLTGCFVSRCVVCVDLCLFVRRLFNFEFCQFENLIGFCSSSVLERLIKMLPIRWWCGCCSRSIFSKARMIL